MKFRNFKVFSVLLSVALLILIFFIALYNRQNITLVMKRADLVWVGLGLGCYSLNYVVRAFRFHMLSRKRVSFFPVAIRSSCLHGFYSYFLPLRSGDLSLPLLLNYSAGLPLLEGSGILLRARLLDLLSLGGLLLVASLFSAPQLQSVVRGVFLLSGLFLFVLPYGFVFLLKLGKDRWVKKLMMQTGDMGIWYPASKEIVVSLLVWFWTGCTVFCVIKSLSIPLAFMDVWFFAAIQLPLQLFPLQGLANAGNHEAGWLAALSLLGIVPVEGLPLSMASHVIFICYVAILGCFALVLPSSRTSVVSETVEP